MDVENLFHLSEAKILTTFTLVCTSDLVP